MYFSHVFLLCSDHQLNLLVVRATVESYSYLKFTVQSPDWKEKPIDTALDPISYIFLKPIYIYGLIEKKEAYIDLRSNKNP